MKHPELAWIPEFSVSNARRILQEVNDKPHHPLQVHGLVSHLAVGEQKRTPYATGRSIYWHE
jgi:hypothetical protein